jgi:hypothetical protein
MGVFVVREPDQEEIDLEAETAAAGQIGFWKTISPLSVVLIAVQPFRR